MLELFFHLNERDLGLSYLSWLVVWIKLSTVKNAFSHDWFNRLKQGMIDNRVIMNGFLQVVIFVLPFVYPSACVSKCGQMHTKNVILKITHSFFNKCETCCE